MKPVLGAFCHQNSVAMRIELTFAKSTIIGNCVLLGSIWYCSDVIMLSGQAMVTFLTSSGTFPHLKRIILKRSWSVDQQGWDHVVPRLIKHLSHYAFWREAGQLINKVEINVDGESDQAALTLCRAGIPIEGWSGVGWQLHGCTTGRQHSIYPPEPIQSLDILGVTTTWLHHWATTELDSTNTKSARYIWIYLMLLSPSKV